MFNNLINLLKERDWEYQILRNNMYQKEAIYFVLGNEELTIFKHQDEKLKFYIELIEKW